MTPVFVAPTQCSNGLHLGTIASLLHADILCRLRNSIGTPSTLLQFWNVTGFQAEKAALELGLPTNPEGCRQAVTLRLNQNLDELRSWEIRPSQNYRDDEIAPPLIEERLLELQRQGRAVLAKKESSLVVSRPHLEHSLKSMQLQNTVLKRLLNCVKGFPARHPLHKDRGYAVELPSLGLSLDPKIAASLMPDLFAPSGTLVLGFDVIERMLLLHIISLAKDASELNGLLIHDLLVGNDGKKMSRHASNEQKAGSSILNPDVVRLGIMNRAVSNSLRTAQLHDPQSIQLRFQFKQIMNVVRKPPPDTIATIEDAEYRAAVESANFKYLFDWVRKIINHDLSAVLIRNIIAGTARPQDVNRAQNLIHVIGTTFLPMTYLTHGESDF